MLCLELFKLLFFAFSPTDLSSTSSDAISSLSSFKNFFSSGLPTLSISIGPDLNNSNCGSSSFNSSPLILPSSSGFLIVSSVILSVEVSGCVLFGSVVSSTNEKRVFRKQKK